MMHEFAHSIRFRRLEFRVSKIETHSPPAFARRYLAATPVWLGHLLRRASHALHCISAPPAALDRYLAAVPAMKYKCGSHLIPFAPFYFFLSLLSNLRKRAVV